MAAELHVSFGPVQAFIAESRRTRDLWVGSYLLSYLAGRGMAAAAQHGRVVLPAVRRETLALYEPGASGHGALPAHASLPNRFVVACDDVAAARAAGHAAVAAIQAAWQGIADAVWKRFVKPVAALGRETAAIWKRQIEGFWEIVWVVGSDPTLLDQRKHWRASAPSHEPGDHCTMMGRYQELSGHVRRHAREAQDAQEAFWAELRAGLAGRDGEPTLDLRPDERLCAIALTKRLLPRVARQALGRPLDADAVAWPSTLHVAAWPWIEAVCKEHPKAARDFAALARRARASACGERKAAEPLVKEYESAGDFPCLDGNFFFERALHHEQDTPLTDPTLREPLVEALQALQKRMGSKASPFFGLLLMDGDRMGQLLRKAPGTGVVTGGLSRFAERVPGIVAAHHGATVYAGGDDVLAFLPVDRALSAALALASAYTRCFEEAALPADLLPGATISGAIVYAHYRLPLRWLLQQAHWLLDHVAKNEAGRASLAMAVHRSSGETARWAAPWAYLRTADGTRLAPLIDCIQRKRLGKSLIYRMRERLGRLSDDDTLGPGKWLSLGALNPRGEDDGALRLLFTAEIQNDREHTQRTAEEVGELVQALLPVCLRVQNASDERGHDVVTPWLSFDGALLAHFLATAGRDEEEA
jgi:CRISPR-associated protein Cmr2